MLSRPFSVGTTESQRGTGKSGWKGRFASRRSNFQAPNYIRSDFVEYDFLSIKNALHFGKKKIVLQFWHAEKSSQSNYFLPGVSWSRVEVSSPVCLQLGHICRFKLDTSKMRMVGDRLDTDTLFGKNAGSKTVLVFSGYTSNFISHLL